MNTNGQIDNGKNFDWGKTSADYAKYRDIYPQELYEKINTLGLCSEGSKVLDIGTGTGVLPRNLSRFGARFVGTDISQNQIEQAKILSHKNNLDIEFICSPSEILDFSPGTFDAITACQCFFYFDHNVLAGKLASFLKEKGKLAVIYMAWLPFEDGIAQASENLILKYNPDWSGCGEIRHNIDIPDVYKNYFTVEHSEVFDINLPFTLKSWNGRMKACRGIGASLSEEEVGRFEEEHMSLLSKIAYERFEILHYCAISILQPTFSPRKSRQKEI